MKQLMGRFPVAWMCRKLGVSRSGFYAFLNRGPSKRAEDDERLKLHIRTAYADSEGTYGSPRVLRELKEQGLRTSQKRVARLMREEGLRGCAKPRFVVTTDSNHDDAIAPNLVARCFEAPGPNHLWVGDLTYVRTWEGWLYLAVLLDVFSRRVVGFATAEHMRTELPLQALQRALEQRGSHSSLVHHTDRGSQYASEKYRELLTQEGITASMSRSGDCLDNAVAESFFATLKKELIYRKTWPTRAKAEAEIRNYIEGFYNVRRKHSSLGYVSPIEFELTYAQAKRAA